MDRHAHHFKRGICLYRHFTASFKLTRTHFCASSFPGEHVTSIAHMRLARLTIWIRFIAEGLVLSAHGMVSEVTISGLSLPFYRNVMRRAVQISGIWQQRSMELFCLRGVKCSSLRLHLFLWALFYLLVQTVNKIFVHNEFNRVLQDSTTKEKASPEVQYVDAKCRKNSRLNELYAVHPIIYG